MHIVRSTAALVFAVLLVQPVAALTCAAACATQRDAIAHHHGRAESARCDVARTTVAMVTPSDAADSHCARHDLLVLRNITRTELAAASGLSLRASDTHISAFVARAFGAANDSSPPGSSTAALRVIRATVLRV